MFEIDSIKSFIETYKILQKPTHFIYSLYLNIKFKILSYLYLKYTIMPGSLSDRDQDAWVIKEVFNKKRKGFFLDIGMADGFANSNTFILEKKYGWRGIGVEPNRLFVKMIKEKYSRNCIVENAAINSISGEVEFLFKGEDGGIVAEDTDYNLAQRERAIEHAREIGNIERIKAITLVELLDRNNAPNVVDYFSLDVEGAEDRVFKDFPFAKYRFLTLTIERPSPELNSLLFANDYHFVRNSLYDTFYIHETLPNFEAIEKKRSLSKFPRSNFEVKNSMCNHSQSFPESEIP